MPPELSSLARFVLPQIEEYLDRKPGACASIEAMRQAVYEHPALVALDKSLIDECLQELFRRRGLIESEQGPRLLVDWGDHPRIGFQARPEFSLICDPSWSEPTISVLIDRQLDHDPDDSARHPRRVDAGLWNFHVPLRLTTKGTACLPGQYLIRVDVAFRSTNDKRPRFYRTLIRLKVPADAATGNRVLEIDGDGQAIVNLHGHDLTAFGKVILKANDRGIINLQASSSSGSGEVRFEASSPETASFEYLLRPNLSVESQLPTVRKQGSPYRAEALTLVAADGRRIHVLSKRRTTFGRGRDNDIVLRFLPRNDANDANSLVLSRIHMEAEFAGDGLVLRNLSNRGIDLNDEPIEEQRTLSCANVGLSHSLELSPMLLGHLPFGLTLRLFGAPSTDVERTEQLAWDEICFDLIGERPGPLWRLSSANRIDACRMVRTTNQTRLEEYVLLYRQATIGANDRAIDLGTSNSGGAARLIHCGRAFWLQTSTGMTLGVDRCVYEEPTLVPLSPGQVVRIDEAEFAVECFAQILDAAE